MTCHDTQALLSAYLDRQLTENEWKDVRLHLETCAACRREEHALLQLKESLRTVRMPGIPADLVAAIEAETIFKPRWWEFPTFERHWAPLVASLAIGLGALFLLHRSQMAPHAAPMTIAKNPIVSSAPVVAMHRDEEPDPTENVH